MKSCSNSLTSKSNALVSNLKNWNFKFLKNEGCIKRDFQDETLVRKHITFWIGFEWGWSVPNPEAYILKYLKGESVF